MTLMTDSRVLTARNSGFSVLITTRRRLDKSLVLQSEILHFQISHYVPFFTWTPIIYNEQIILIVQEEHDGICGCPLDLSEISENSTVCHKGKRACNKHTGWEKLRLGRQ